MEEKSVTDRTRVVTNVVHVDPIPEGIIDGNGECFPQKGRVTHTQGCADEATPQWNWACMYACDCV